jgi:hypothetical protein
MAEDWVEKYLESNRTSERREELLLSRAKFVDQGSSVFFEELRQRVQYDLEKFCASTSDCDTSVSGSVNQFLISRTIFPMVKPLVTLNGPTIYYRYSCRVDRSQAEMKEVPTGMISLRSDLEGNLSARINGKLTADHSQISEFLLTPVFDCLSHR